MSGIPNYSVLKGQIVSIDEDRDSNPHYRIFISGGTKTYKAAIAILNEKSIDLVHKYRNRNSSSFYGSIVQARNKYTIELANQIGLLYQCWLD